MVLCDCKQLVSYTTLARQYKIMPKITHSLSSLLFSTSKGYDSYAWPEGFRPANVPVCEVIPPDGRGVPEQVCAIVSNVIIFE